jgi:hypothetical protein
MTDLDKKVKELATTDWEKFMQVAGPDFILTFKARIMRSEGKSWQQISMKLEITPMQARVCCKNIAVKKQQTKTA